MEPHLKTKTQMIMSVSLRVGKFLLSAV